MRALDLDLVRHRPAWPAWLMLAVGVALAGDALLRYLALNDQMTELQRRRVAPAAAATAPREAVSEQTQRELDAARRVLQELTLPWEPLFRTIEGAIGNDAALLAIEPDAGKRFVRITGEARDYQAVLGLMVRLEEPQVLGGVHLLSHEVREDLAERPVQFTLGGSWRLMP